MAADQALPARSAMRSWTNGQEQSPFCRRSSLDRQDGGAVARSAGTLRQLELGVPAVQPLVQTWRVAAFVRGVGGRSRPGACVARIQYCPSASTCRRRKRGVNNEALGRSRGGWTTKIHVAVNGHGQPIRFSLTGGERHDITEAETLLQNLSPDYVIADKGYDSDPLRQQIRKQGAKPVIPSRRAIRRRRYDRTRYKLRNVVERFFNRVKHYRRVATRYEKTDQNYMGFVCLASLVTTVI